MVECLPADRSATTLHGRSAPAFGEQFRPPQMPASPLGTAAGAVTIEIFRSIEAAEPHWRRLEERGCVASPYQRFDLLALWQRHVGQRAGVAPLIVSGFDSAGEPCFLWPFGRVRHGGLRVVRFLGSKHANFNVGIWHRDVVTGLAACDLRAWFELLKNEVDLLMLRNQPLIWGGVENPFALLPHQPSVDDSACLHLIGKAPQAIEDVLSSTMRGRLRTKERKLKRLAGYGYTVPSTDAEIDRLLDEFFALKASHMAAQGLGNVFADAGVAEFLREGCRSRLPDGRRLIEIHALEGGGEVLALFGAVVDDYRFSSMFNTYTRTGNARHSPGLILLVYMINECGVRGVRSFDIGVGRAHYKSLFCPETEPLFDVVLALTARGRLAAPAFAAGVWIKRSIKQNRALWSAVQFARRLRAVENG
jgi:CelD/BcsL family acetyltransferase involved in cellulose biosynthesis